ncbi:uncharacterized protein LOC113343665 [Papaver somniferum]|uniref:uncharacterized protein LOC113343665 n=1 Tax=Papaver somniferum TaxID=3469 RepID=UPI000E6F7F65|nr:uncharacterized protein LOC113343665 [Papaver somniferum]
MWLTHPHLKQIVESAWSQQNDSEPTLNLQLKLITTGQILMEWNKETFGHLPNLIKKSTAQIQRAQHQCAITYGDDLEYWITREKELRSQHLNLLECHATYWKQRFRILWLQSGDNNTTFFHTKATIHRSRNNIQQLQDPQNKWVSEKDQVIQIILDHFTNQYTAPPTTIDETLFAEITPRLTPAQCDKLSAEVMIAEIKQALFSINSESAPGPDGYTSKFFKVFWETTQV